MTPAMQAARDRVVEAAKKRRLILMCFQAGEDIADKLYDADAALNETVRALLALEAKEQAGEG